MPRGRVGWGVTDQGGGGLLGTSGKIHPSAQGMDHKHTWVSASRTEPRKGSGSTRPLLCPPSPGIAQGAGMPVCEQVVRTDSAQARSKALLTKSKPLASQARLRASHRGCSCCTSLEAEARVYAAPISALSAPMLGGRTRASSPDGNEV